jgi:hypothetical protein
MKAVYGLFFIRRRCDSASWHSELATAGGAFSSRVFERVNR